LYYNIILLQYRLKIIQGKSRSLAVTVPCAAYDAYVSPKSFAVGFTVGMTADVIFGVIGNARLALTTVGHSLANQAQGRVGSHFKIFPKKSEKSALSYLTQSGARSPHSKNENVNLRPN